MRRIPSLLLPAILIVLLCSCAVPQGEMPDDKRSAIDTLHDDALARLYKQRPSAQEVIDRAAGYATFSNVSVQFLIVGGGGGHGVAVDQASGQRTYMKMAQIDLGLGFGVNDLRVVFVFHSTRAYTAFVNDGWDFGGQLDLTAKTLDQGPSAIGEMTIDAETTVFTMSKEGAMAKVNLAGTKYWKDESLNRALY